MRITSNVFDLKKPEQFYYDRDLPVNIEVTGYVISKIFFHKDVMPWNGKNYNKYSVQNINNYVTRGNVSMHITCVFLLGFDACSNHADFVHVLPFTTFKIFLTPDQNYAP